MDEKYDVFLSHNSADKPAVRKIATRLKRAKLQPFLDEIDLTPGRTWQQELAEALNNCRCVAVFYGPVGEGGWHDQEKQVALKQAVAARDDGYRVIPVLLLHADDQQVDTFVSLRTWIDLRNTADERKQFKRLVDAIRDVAGSTPVPSKTAASLAKPAARLIGPHNLPFASIESLFVGREQTLIDLREKLATAPAASIVARQAIHGLGGVGKSRLAVEFTWRYAANYTALLFVSADGAAALQRGLAELCGVLQLPEQAAREEAVQVEAALGWLAERDGWLLILDNADSDEAAEEVIRLLPRLHRGHVLITSRRSRWPAEVAPLELDVLAEADAVAFLLARTADTRQAEPDDEQAAAELAEELGCLALALEQAAAYIGWLHQRLRDYLGHWRDMDTQVREWFDPLVTHYPPSIATTWQTSIEMLSEAGRELLQTLCWLAPDPIPGRLLDDQWQEAAADLADYSLIRWDREREPALRMHRLVQDVTRRSIPEEERNQWIERALQLLDAALPSGYPADVRTWPDWEPLRPHVAFAAAEADSHGIAEPTTRLMGELGTLLWAKALYAEAEQLERRALAIDERHFGRDSTQVAARLNNLAQTLQATNRLAEAEPMLRRAVEIFEASLGPDHPNTQTVAGNYRLLLEAMKKGK